MAWVRYIKGLLVFLGVMAGLTTAPSMAQEAHTRPGITVMADPSLTVPLTLIARAYAVDYQIPVSAQFAPTNLQIGEVEEGAEANVFIASKAIWLRQLEAKGLIDVYSRTPVARNTLVLAASGPGTPQITLGSPLTSLSFLPKGLKEEELSFALGDPEYTSEGTYALDALSRLRLDGELEPYFTFFRDMRSLSQSINTSGAYGLMFRTDIMLLPRLHSVASFTEAMHTPIVYEAVTVAGENMAGGRHFVDFLTSDKARAIFTRHGFLPVL
jgi:molybdate transport system substrate-binding protein